MASPNLNLFNVPTISDFAREEEEFNMRKQQQAVQAQLAQAQLKKASELDIDALSDKALFNFYQGKPLTEADMAAVQARAVKEGKKTEYSKDDYGNLVPTTSDNPYSQFLAGLEGGQFKPAQTPRSAMPPQVFGNMLGGPALEDTNIPQVTQDTFSFDGYGGMDPMQASQDAIAQRKQYLANGNPWDTGSALPDYQDNLQLDATAQDMMNQEDAQIYNAPAGPQLDPMVANSPYGKKAIFDQNLKLREDLNNPNTEIGKMQRDERLGLVPVGSTDALIKEKTRQSRKEDLSLQKEEQAAKEAEQQAASTKKIAENKVKEALGVLNKSMFASGFPATLALGVPGKALPPAVLNSAYSTLKSNISLEKMLQLKAASPTGATGFGALSAPELKILTDAIAELDAELPMDQQIANLQIVSEMLGLDIPELKQQQNIDPIDAELRRRGVQ